MCHTTSSVRSLTRVLELSLDDDGERGLREFDRRETEAVIRHLLGEPVERDEP